MPTASSSGVGRNWIKSGLSVKMQPNEERYGRMEEGEVCICIARCSTKLTKLGATTRSELISVRLQGQWPRDVPQIEEKKRLFLLKQRGSNQR